jgi:hypothetical protein
VQEQAEPLVGDVPESEADPLDPLDEQIHGFGWSVAPPAGGEVGEQLVLPRRDRAAEPFQLRHTGGGAGQVEGVQPAPGPVGIGSGVQVPQLWQAM